MLVLLNGLCRLYGCLGLLFVALGVLGPPADRSPLFHGLILACLLITSVGLLAYSFRHRLWSRTFWKAWFVWMITASVLRFAMSDYWSSEPLPAGARTPWEILLFVLGYLLAVSLPVHLGIFRYAWRNDPHWRELDRGSTKGPAPVGPGQDFPRPNPAL